MEEREKDNRPVIIAVGGGKGGVGKSLISSGIATALALSGKSTVCIDLDLGGANLHTFFGLRSTDKGIGDFIYRPHSKDLADYSLDCQVRNLRLISGAGFIPGIANLYYFQKLKILRAIQRLRFDYVVLDLGAGTNYNVIDFFSITRSGIVVTNPEPTAILNAYEFIKNVLFRIFTRSFKQGHIALEIIEAHKFGENQEQGTNVRDMLEQLQQVDKDAWHKVRCICQEFKPALVLNMVKSQGHSNALASNLMDICRNFLDIELKYLGAVPRDETVAKELIKLNNLVLSRPEAPSSKAIIELGKRCMTGFRGQRIELEDRLEDQAKVKVAGGDERSGGERQQLAHMLKHFFVEFKRGDLGEIAQIEAGSGKTEAEKGAPELSAMDILEPGLRFQQELLSPLLLDIEDLKLENFKVPDKLRQLLVFIAELTDLEASIGEAGQGPDRSEIARAWFKTGMILVKSGQFSSALRSFDRALSVESGLWEARLNRACCLMTLGRFDEAKGEFQQIISTGYSVFHVTFNYGLLNLMMGQYARAFELISGASTPQGLEERSKILSSYALYHMGRIEEARDLLESVDSKQEYYNLGLIYMQLGKYDKALEFLKLALQQDRHDSMTMALSAVCMRELGLIKESFGMLEKALTLQPADIRYRALMAYYSLESDIMDRAVREAQVIAKLRPSNPNLLGLVTEICNCISNI